MYNTALKRTGKNFQLSQKPFAFFDRMRLLTSAILGKNWKAEKLSTIKSNL